MSHNTYDPISKKLNQISGNEEAKAVKLEDLPNVDATSVADGQTLVWDATNSKWKNGRSGGNIPINPSSTNDINMWVVTD